MAYKLKQTGAKVQQLLDAVEQKTVYPDATEQEHGLMSTSDKTKLDNTYSKQEIDAGVDAIRDEMMPRINNLATVVNDKQDKLVAGDDATRLNGAKLSTKQIFTGSIDTTAGAVPMLLPTGGCIYNSADKKLYIGDSNSQPVEVVKPNDFLFFSNGKLYHYQFGNFGEVETGGTTVVNNLTEGGEESALSAEMGKKLKGMIDNVGVKFGTYAEALDAILVSNSVFEWLLVDKVDSGELIKPLWHVNGSLIDAAGAVVSLATLTAPVFSRDSGDVTVGTTVTITCPSGSTLYYSVNGIAATSTSDVTITINEASVVKAYLKSGNAVSDIVAKSYGIAIDHKFQFKIKLTGDNSTEYVPVIAIGSPKYTMTVDWGDDSTPSEYTNKYFKQKGCGHTYSGKAGDEFVITLRGTAIPYLHFKGSGDTNPSALVAILENTLECKTNFSASGEKMITMSGCTSLNYLSADAFSNSIDNGLSLGGCPSLTSLEDGFFTNLISGGAIKTCSSMFMNTPVAITASQMSELKSRLSQCAEFDRMFYGVKNYIEIPNDFFDDVEVKITSVYAFTHTSGNKVTGDAKALYDALQSKVSSNVSTQYAFTGSGLSNRNQVPGAWGGTGS